MGTWVHGCSQPLFSKHQPALGGARRMGAWAHVCVNLFSSYAPAQIIGVVFIGGCAYYELEGRGGGWYD